ncbi:MAG: hypothetical protein ACTSRG_19515 [Candidatus Helarchaeota archaeon]
MEEKGIDILNVSAGTFIKNKYRNFSKWVRETALAEIKGNFKSKPALKIENIEYRYSNGIENKLIEKLEEINSKLDELFKRLSIEIKQILTKFFKSAKKNKSKMISNNDKIIDVEEINNIFKGGK